MRRRSIRTKIRLRLILAIVRTVMRLNRVLTRPDTNNYLNTQIELWTDRFLVGVKSLQTDDGRTGYRSYCSTERGSAVALGVLRAITSVTFSPVS